MNHAQLLAQFADLDPAAFCDADKSIRVLAPSISRVNPGPQMLGRARTVRVFDDFLTIIEALSVSEPGEVLVIDTQGTARAVVGELFSLEASRRGLAGIVIDGACRDTETIMTLDLPVYATHRTPVSGTVQRLFETQVPIICGGVEVLPGDIIFGDSDGIIALSDREAEELLDQARTIKTTELKAIAAMSNGQSLIDVTNFHEHAKALRSGKAQSRLSFELDD
jgi:4-hydroxy-4-methyl-2-oxoglutarate aldolase